MEIIHCCFLYTFQKLKTGKYMYVGNYTRILWMILIQTCKHSIQQQDMFSLLLWTVSAVLPAIQISLLFFWWQQLIVSVLSLISFLTMFQVTTSGPSDIVHHSKWSRPISASIISFVCFTWGPLLAIKLVFICKLSHICTIISDQLKVCLDKYWHSILRPSSEF